MLGRSAEEGARLHGSWGPLAVLARAKSIRLRSMPWLLLALMLTSLTLAMEAGHAQNADELFTVNGVEVDVTDANAAQAKLKAISQAQVKAFRILSARLGEDSALSRLDNLKASDIGRMMSSLSVESERTGPRRYIGKLTIKFLPDRVRQTLSQAGVPFTEERAPVTLVLPVWQPEDGALLWDDNVWRAAWEELNLINSTVPLLLPLGDAVDSSAISAQQALEADASRLESLKLRYSAPGALVAVAQPVSKNAVRIVVSGDSPVGQVQFDHTYTADDGDIAKAAALAAAGFHAALRGEWKRTKAQLGPVLGASQAVLVAVPFQSLQEWNSIRTRLKLVSGVTEVKVQTLAQGGALVNIVYAVPFPELQSGLAQSRLQLQLQTGRWTLLSF